MVTSKRISNFGLPGPGTPRAANPADITDWIGSGGRGVNPTQPGDLFNPSAVFGWVGGPTANHGINPVNTENDPDPNHQAAPAPFRDNGNDDTTVAFMQIAQFMQQNITGLVPGTNYLFSLQLQFAHEHPRIILWLS